MSEWCATRSTAIGASDSDTPTCGVRPLSSRVRRSASITRSKTPTSSRSCCEKADGRRPASGSPGEEELDQDRKSTRLNSSHSQISYAVFCLKKKKRLPEAAGRRDGRSVIVGRPIDQH